MNISSISSYITNVAQEELETAAQTKAEAAKGDQQAIRKLALQQASQAAPRPEPAAAASHRSKHLLDVTA